MESSRHAEEGLNFDLLRSLTQTNQIIKTRIKPPPPPPPQKKTFRLLCCGRRARAALPSGAWKEKIVAGWLPPTVPTAAFYFSSSCTALCLQLVIKRGGGGKYLKGGDFNDGQVKFNTNISKEMTSEPKLTCQIQLRITRSCTTEALRTAAPLILALTEALEMNSIEDFFFSESTIIIASESKQGEGRSLNRSMNALKSIPNPQRLAVIKTIAFSLYSILNTNNLFTAK